MLEPCGNTQAEIDRDTAYPHSIDRSAYDGDDSAVMLTSEQNYFEWVCKTLNRGWKVLGRDKKYYSLSMYPQYDVKVVAALVVG